jgi:hypothetical protein
LKVIIVVITVLGFLSCGVGSASTLTTPSPDKQALDTASRDFVVPLRGCAQVVDAFVAFWNTDRIRLLSYLKQMRSSCREARTQMLQVPASGFTQAGKDGRRAFGLFLSGMALFDEGATLRAESLVVRARNQFVRGQSAYKRAMTSLNRKRAAAGLGPLPLKVRP